MMKFADANNIEVSYGLAINRHKILHYTHTVLDVKSWFAAQVIVPCNISKVRLLVIFDPFNQVLN